MKEKINVLKKKDLRLYVVTDRSWLGEMTLREAVEEALRGGASMVQLREKDISRIEFVSEGLDMRMLCDKYCVPFIVNDDVDMAIKVSANGVHLGQDDMSVSDARSIIGDDPIIGVSVQTVEQAKKAEEDGADYLGVGAVFQTSTKTDAKPVSLDTVKSICEAVSIPVCAIGGINAENVSELGGLGLSGAAVVSAVFAADDIRNASRKLRELCDEAFE